MNQSRYDQVAAQTASNPSSPPQNNPNTPNLERRIFPNNHGSLQFAHNHNVKNKSSAEEELKQACIGFFGVISRLQIITILFFTVLMLFTQIVQGQLSIALICYRSFGSAYTVALLRAFCIKSMSKKEKLEMCYRFLETAVLIAFFGSNVSDDDRVTNIILFSIFLGSYLLRMIYSYTMNRSKYSDFVNNMNKLVLLLRALIFAQGVLVLVQLSLESPITWFAVLIPAWTIITVILLFTAHLFKSVYFTYTSQIWESEVSEKKRAAKWVFGNLFAFLLLSVCMSLLVAFVFDGYISESNRPFLGPFLVLILWCIASLRYAQGVHVGILKFFQETIYVFDSKGKREEQGLEYVVKVSNAYFKLATEQDIKQQIKCKNDDLEAGLTNMPTESNNCLVCCKNEPDGVFMGCGHGGICFECGKEIIKAKKECHMCREKINSLLKLKMDIANSKGMYYKIVEKIGNDEDQLEDKPFKSFYASLFSYIGVQ